MAGVSMDEVKTLRDRTGVSIMQCKKALEEAGGDQEKALVLLSKKGGAAAEKKTGRALCAGTVAAYIHATKDIGTLVLLSSETDFVSKNPEFTQLAYDIAMHAAATAPQYISRAAIPTEDVTKVKESLADEVQDKPADMQEKILGGKVDAYFKDKVLLEQPFIKDESVTIGGLVEKAIQKFGERIEVVEMSRFSVR